MAPVSTTAPSMTQACMPMKHRSFNVHAWMTAAWPMVTWSPMKVPYLRESTWTTVRSWMLTRLPMRMTFMSPRTRQPNQMLVSAPISTSPMTLAVGARKTLGSMVGQTPLKGMMLSAMDSSVSGPANSASRR